MAIRDIGETKVNRPHRVSIVRIILAFLLVGILFVGVSQMVGDMTAAANYKEETSILNEAATAVSEESSQIYEILEDEKALEEYYEKELRENYGYCKSGEVIYYDSSFSE